MLRVEFFQPVNEQLLTYCNGISVDPMDDTVFLIQFAEYVLWQTPLNNIKHISSYEHK